MKDLKRQLQALLIESQSERSSGRILGATPPPSNGYANPPRGSDGLRQAIVASSGAVTSTRSEYDVV